MKWLKKLAIVLLCLGLTGCTPLPPESAPDSSPDQTESQSLPEEEKLPEDSAEPESSEEPESTSEPESSAESENTSEPESSQQESTEPESSETPESSPESETSSAVLPEEEKPLPASASAVLAQMTLHEKVCQMFTIRPEQLHLNGQGDFVTAVDGNISAALREYPVGGIALFAQNIILPKQCSSLTAGLQQSSRIPLLIGVDEEGGMVARLGNNPDMKTTAFPNMMTIGSSGDPKKAYQAGNTIGKDIRRYGFNWDFAPVADVATNPKNSVIGRRAFSSDPQITAQMTEQAVKGLTAAGVVPTLKHFPGHGNTAEDSHTGLAYTYKTPEELKACEFIPFRQGIQAGADAVMTAHVTSPNADSSGLPATLSPYMLQEVLRGELGFQGMIVTDSLQMQAILKLYSTEEAVIMAVRAGADMLLDPIDLEIAVQALEQAVSDGRIPESRIDESVLRILRIKEKYGILS